MSDNGSTFRVVVSNAAGTMTSNAAVLNVTAGFFGSVHHYPALQPRRNRGTEGDLCRGRIGHGSAQLSVEERDYQHLGRNLPQLHHARPTKALLEFCQSTYEAAAILSKWDRPAFQRKNPESSATAA